MAKAIASVKKKIQVSLEEGGVAHVTINGTKVAEISPEGNVVPFTDFQVKPATADAIAKGSTSLGIIEAFNIVTLYGATSL